MSASAAYAEFLASKATVAGVDGFLVGPGEVNAVLYPHQRRLVEWAVLGGRRAVFAAFGLGKTVIQLETVRLTLSRAGGRGLIVCPLGVGSLKVTLRACGHGAAGKHLPPEAFTLPKREANALLTGYLSGDGHFRTDRQRWMASSVSRDLLLGVAMLAQRVHGAIASVYAGRPAREAVIDGRTVECRQDWILSFAVDDPRRKQPFVLGDGAWKRVRSIEDAGEVETWNLRVADDESFTAEGCIVKNCPLQIDIVDRLITRYSNPGDVVLDPFSGLGTVPVRALALGRQGLGVELNGGYFLDAVTYLQAEERKHGMPSLFDTFESAA